MNGVTCHALLHAIKEERKSMPSGVMGGSVPRSSPGFCCLPSLEGCHHVLAGQCKCITWVQAVLGCLSTTHRMYIEPYVMPVAQMEATHLLRGVALLDERGPDWAWCNSIHSDTPADQMRPKALCESGHGTLQPKFTKPLYICMAQLTVLPCCQAAAPSCTWPYKQLSVHLGAIDYHECLMLGCLCHLVAPHPYWVHH